MATAELIFTARLALSVSFNKHCSDWVDRAMITTGLGIVGELGQSLAREERDVADGINRGTAKEKEQ